MSHNVSLRNVDNYACISNRTGAKVLTSKAAVRSGTGLTALNTHSDIYSTITNHVPEATLFDRKDDLSDFIDDKDVIAIGPGLGVNEDTRSTTEYLIEHFEEHLIISS